RMVLEVLSARLDQRLAGLFRRIRKREIDVVKEHRVLSCCVVSVLRGGALERLRRGTEPKPDYDREAPRLQRRWTGNLLRLAPRPPNNSGSFAGARLPRVEHSGSLPLGRPAKAAMGEPPPLRPTDEPCIPHGATALVWQNGGLPLEGGPE